MIDLAARTTRGVTLLSRKETRQYIIRLFKKQMNALKERLNVGSAHMLCLSLLIILQSTIVTGDVSLTCDAWQASNTDGYFAVAGHWIKEMASGDWNEEEALFGFTQMNTAHNGTRLGQELYKICSRLSIVHKVLQLYFQNFYRRKV